MDGTIQIRNKKTGEVKTVKKSELNQFGITPKQFNPVDEYARGVQQGLIKLNDVPSEYRAGVISSLPPEFQYPEDDNTDQIDKELKVYEEKKKIDQEYATNEPTADERKQEQAMSGVLSLIDELKYLYNQPTATGNKPNPNRRDDLSAAGKGAFAPIQGLLLNFKAATNLAPDAKTYKRIKEGFSASLKEATGDTGVLTDEDRALIINALPNFGDDDEAARKGFESIDRILMGKYGKTGKYNYLEAEGNTGAGNDNQGSTGQSEQFDLGRAIAFNPVSDAIIGTGNFLAPRFIDIFGKLGRREQVSGGDVLSGGVDLGLAATTPFTGGGSFLGKSLLGKTLSGGLKTTAPGAIYGATEAGDQSLEDRFSKAGAGALGSLLTAGALKTPGAIKDKVVGQAKDRVSQLFKISTTQLSEFRRNTKLDFAQEFIDRDLKNVVGKKTEDLTDYFEQKYNEFYKKTDKFLRSKGITIKPQEVASLLDNEIKKLKSNSRLGQSTAIQELTKTRDEILGKKVLDLADINQYKRDIQDMAGDAIGGGQSSSAVKKAFDDTQRALNTFIEIRAPGSKAINKATQYYRLAKDSIQKKADQEAKSEGSSVLGSILKGGLGPTTAGAAAQLASGNSLFTLLGLTAGGVGAGLNYYSKTSQAKTRFAKEAIDKKLKLLPEPLKRILQLGGGRFGAGN